MADDRVKAEMISNPAVTRTFSKPSWEQQKDRGIWRAVDSGDEVKAEPKNVVAANVGRRPLNNEKLIAEMAAHARLNQEVKAQPEPVAEEFVKIEEPTPVEVQAEQPRVKRKYTKRVKTPTE